MNQSSLTFQELAEKVVNQVKASRRLGAKSKPEGRLSECGKYVVLKISKGKEVLVDIDDFETVAQYRWKASQSSCRWYAKRNARSGSTSRVLAMHRLIMGAKIGECVDHINGDSLDNRKSNLRLCTRSENQWAKRKNYKGSNSKYRGVYWDKRDRRYIAQVTFKWKRYHVGSFTSEIEAARARDRKAFELFGNIAHLNFPEITHP